MSEPRLFDRIGDVGAKLLPWGILGFMGVGIWGGEVSESIQRLVQQNGGTLFLVALGMPYVGRLIEAQNKQASAITQMSDSIRQLAATDTYQQQEIRGVLHVVAEDLREVKDALGQRPCAMHAAGLPLPGK